MDTAGPPRPPPATASAAIAWRYRWPLAAALASAPVVVLAVLQSLAWVGRPFPGFFVMDNGVVASVGGLDWTPDRSELFNSRVVAVDGVPVSGGGEILDRLAERPVGAAVRYTLRRGGETHDVTLPIRRFFPTDYVETFGILLLAGCAWLAFGIVVGVLQPETRPARVYLWQSMIGGLFPITAVFLYQPGAVPLTWLHIVLQCVFPATWIHLALVFPIDRLGTPWRSSWLWIAYGVSLVLAALTIGGFFAEPPDLRAAYAAYGYAALGLAVFLAAQAIAFVRDRSGRARARVKAMIPGVAPAVVVASLALLEATLRHAMPLQLGLVLAPLFLAGIAHAIARHDLFDIDRVVRQSFVYAALSVIVAGAYGIALAGSTRLVPSVNSALLGMLVVAGLAVAIEPLRRAVQAAIDRAFYRTRPDYEQTIGALSAAMTTLLRSDEIVAQLTRVLIDAMHLESAAVCVFGPEADVTVWARRPEGAPQPSRGPACLYALGRRLAERGGPMAAGEAAQLLGDAGPEVAVALAALRAELLVPLTFQRRSTGMLVLGRTRSGRPPPARDTPLLRTLADQTAIALSNARSFRALEDLTRDLDAKVQEQTAALRDSHRELSVAYDELRATQAQLVQSEKLASLGQLVAGVAHELNNPASFVHGSLDNLCRYVERLADMVRRYEQVPIADADLAHEIEAARQATHLEHVLREAPALLRACAEGSERIKRIVDDLRVFVRADRGERAPTDVVAGIESARRLLAHRLGGIEIETDYAGGATIEADTGQLNQVWMNLLDNAVDALAESSRPRIAIAVRRLASANGSARGWVEVSIRDSGSGIAAEVLPRVFDPFFTTKPVGRGTGLGLSIAYGTVQSHGGTIEIASRPGEGTVVTVRLPERS